jgi:uncharacterized small protein (DUF1192 family)
MIIIEKQDERFAHLQSEIEKLRSWCDLNNHYLQEMVDSNCSAIDRLRTVINEMHDGNEINDRIQELEAEEQMPVAQLLRNFIEDNATEEEKTELNNVD